jgi:phosphatidylethanolamine/phosphatidyl-N-methylethanolamine N-methyltransferase
LSHSRPARLFLRPSYELFFYGPRSGIRIFAGRAESVTQAMADYSATTYDHFMAPLEWLGLQAWRRQLLRWVQPPVLEIGVGTGASLRWYPETTQVVAIDREAGMAASARARALALGRPATIGQMDVHHLAFLDQAFACVVTSLVFCSVTDPLLGLREVRRVLRPGGRLVMLEHVRPANQLLGGLADALDAPWHAFSQDCHLNRRTADSVRAVGFSLELVQKKLFGAVNVIVAHK